MWVLPRQTRPARVAVASTAASRSGTRPREERGAGLGGDAGGVEEVLPADRHAVERAAAQAGLGARPAAAAASARARSGVVRA